MPSMTHRDRRWFALIGFISGAVILTVAVLILAPRQAGAAGRLDVRSLPALNAALNASSATLLLLGYGLIRRRDIRRHRWAMIAAFAASAMFLVSYVVYHANKAGPRPYTGDWPSLYFAVLVSHVLLAIVILPLALATLYLGWTRQDPRHRRLARWTLPLWLYVSVTGVLVYLMLY